MSTHPAHDALTASASQAASAAAWTQDDRRRWSRVRAEQAADRACADLIRQFRKAVPTDDHGRWMLTHVPGGLYAYAVSRLLVAQRDLAAALDPDDESGELAALADLRLVGPFGDAEQAEQAVDSPILEEAFSGIVSDRLRALADNGPEGDE